MYVSHAAIFEATGKTRHSAQAKALSEMYPGIVLTRRLDGSVALRQDELDRYTLTGGGQKAKVKRDWRPSLSVLEKVG